MRTPIHTPISREAERIAAMLLKLEQSPAPDLVLTALAVHAGGRYEPKVIARLDDGDREVFTPEEARFFARCVLADAAYVEAPQHAEALRKAADEADARASSGALTHQSGRLRDPAQRVGTWR